MLGDGARGEWEAGGPITPREARGGVTRPLPCGRWLQRNQLTAVPVELGKLTALTTL